MSKLGLAIAGTLATGAIGAGAFIGYQQLSNNSKTISNTNSNVSVKQADSNPADSNELLGTWVNVDNQENKVTFTADEMISLERGGEVRSKYTRLSNDEIEIVIEDIKLQFKTTFEGDLLTLIGGKEPVKLKRESANANANTNPNTPAAVDYSKFKELKTLNGNLRSVMSVAFSPDGKTLASGGGDNSIKLWRAE